MDLRGKRILLTGASSGIGAVAACKLAAEGASIIAVARRESLLAEVVERITASLHNFRHLPVRFERLAFIHEAFMKIACYTICWR